KNSAVKCDLGLWDVVGSGERSGKWREKVGGKHCALHSVSNVVQDRDGTIWIFYINSPWILLLQEFNVIIRDKKGAENLAANHLSRLENPHQDELEKKEIIETFPLETLGIIAFRGDSSTPWITPDLKASRARGFVHHPLEL
nr:reverse transcriptase domain-containing protein [Tanacetum cinerariifolium]